MQARSAADALGDVLTVLSRHQCAAAIVLHGSIEQLLAYIAREPLPSHMNAAYVHPVSEVQGATRTRCQSGRALPRFEMERELPFEPAALLAELYSLESIVQSVLSGDWQRCAPFFTLLYIIYHIAFPYTRHSLNTEVDPSRSASLPEVVVMQILQIMNAACGTMLTELCACARHLCLCVRL